MMITSKNLYLTVNLNINNGLLLSDSINNRIGINNMNPQYTLDVKGTSNILGNIIVNGFNYNYYTIDNINTLVTLPPSIKK